MTAETSGVLDTIVPEGQEVKIGEVVATIDDSKTAPPEEKQAGRPKTKEHEEEKKVVGAPKAFRDDPDRTAQEAAIEPGELAATIHATEHYTAVRRILEV